MAVKVIDILNSKTQRLGPKKTRNTRMSKAGKKPTGKGQKKKPVKTKSIKQQDHDQEDGVLTRTTKQKGPWRDLRKWQLERKAYSQVILLFFRHPLQESISLLISPGPVI